MDDTWWLSRRAGTKDCSQSKPSSGFMPQTSTARRWLLVPNRAHESCLQRFVQVFKWRISGEIFWNAMTCHFHPFWGLESQHVDLATKHTIRLFKRLNFLHFRATLPSNFCVVMAAASQKDVLKLALRPKKCLHMFAPWSWTHSRAHSKSDQSQLIRILDKYNIHFPQINSMLGFNQSCFHGLGRSPRSWSALWSFEVQRLTVTCTRPLKRENLPVKHALFVRRNPVAWKFLEVQGEVGMGICMYWSREIEFVDKWYGSSYTYIHALYIIYTHALICIISI